MKLANSSADARGQAPPVDYVEPGGPATITNPVTSPEVGRDLEPTPFAYRTSGDETRGPRRMISFFLDTMQGWRLASGDVANGLHAVIARQANGMPVGQQTPWPQAQPSTFFRAPTPWDRGTVRATPDNSNAQAVGFEPMGS